MKTLGSLKPSPIRIMEEPLTFTTRLLRALKPRPTEKGPINHVVLLLEVPKPFPSMYCKYNYRYRSELRMKTAERQRL
jgi:hypothetical protein